MIFFIKRDFPLFNTVNKVIKTVIYFIPIVRQNLMKGSFTLFHRKKTPKFGYREKRFPYL